MNVVNNKIAVSRCSCYDWLYMHKYTAWQRVCAIVKFSPTDIAYTFLATKSKITRFARVISFSVWCLLPAIPNPDTRRERGIST